MPKKGEKSRKLRLLSSGKGVRPPKKWFIIMKRHISNVYPKLGKKRQELIIGGIWSKMSIASKKKIVRKYQK